jgi:hypothetical protein
VAVGNCVVTINDKSHFTFVIDGATIGKGPALMAKRPKKTEPFDVSNISRMLACRGGLPGSSSEFVADELVKYSDGRESRRFETCQSRAIQSVPFCTFSFIKVWHYLVTMKPSLGRTCPVTRSGHM